MNFCENIKFKEDMAGKIKKGVNKTMNTVQKKRRKKR